MEIIILFSHFKVVFKSENNLNSDIVYTNWVRCPPNDYLSV